MSNNKKGEFVVIIILLVIFVPGMILGIVGKVQNGKDKDSESSSTGGSGGLPTNILDLVDSAGNYLGAYICNDGVVYCGFAYETIDDSTYHLDYYDDGNIETIGVIANTYAFIVEGTTEEEYYRSAPIKLYNIINQETVMELEAVKNYTAGIEGGMFIVKQNGKWGILVLNTTSASLILEPSYDYIGLANVRNTDGSIISDEFVAMSGGSWSIINSTGESLFGSLNNEIVDYNGQNVIALNSVGKQILYSYSGTQLLSGNVYNKIIFVGRYVGVFDNSNQFYIIDQNTDQQITTNRYDYANTSDVTLDYQDNRVTIKVNGEVVESNVNV